ncbi:MAG: hypothetical protein HYY65_06865 [Candidatus Tectomicrobia bacterium]|uniref:Uncharacterized protein n=1 Tax=Tectimicrobiota bacterium TaxID=2528274 RepID=A0A932M048_UNCTE|nr:hypothetical protein [Candidatus Tectomicrobia bacterium]
MTDTSPAAAALQTRIHGGLTGSARLRIAVEMSLVAREMSLVRLRRQHPEWSDSELRRELLRYSFASGTLPPVLR